MSESASEKHISEPNKIEVVAFTAYPESSPEDRTRLYNVRRKNREVQPGWFAVGAGEWSDGRTFVTVMRPTEDGNHDIKKVPTAEFEALNEAVTGKDKAIREALAAGALRSTVDIENHPPRETFIEPEADQAMTRAEHQELIRQMRELDQ